MGEALRRFVVDTRGQDVIEYGLLGGLIATAGMALLPSITSKMSALYANTITQVQNIWDPCPPGGCP
jgi:Flp pilus assembly pilin Flp